MTQSFRYTKGFEQSSIILHSTSTGYVNKKNTHTSSSFNLEQFSCLVACVVTQLQQITDCLYLPVWSTYPLNVLYAVCDTYPCAWTCTHKVSNWNEIVIWSRIQSGNRVPVTHTCIFSLSKQANGLITRSACSRLCFIPRSCPITL